MIIRQCTVQQLATKYGLLIPTLLSREADFTTYGEEVKFGGGKVIRDGMGQSQTARSREP